MTPAVVPFRGTENGHLYSPPQEGPSCWRVLWTHSHFEQLVHDQLTAKGYQPFLPTVEVWSRRGGQKHLARRPLFSGYLFLNHPLDKASHVDVLKVRGLVRVLEEGTNRLAAVPDHEVEAIRRVVDGGLPARTHPYLREGQRVRVIRGPLRDVLGILVRYRSRQGLLVLSVELLQRSVAVEVDCTSVAPA